MRAMPYLANMLENTVDHLLHNVLAAATDYMAAEDALSQAYGADRTPAAWERAARPAGSSTPSRSVASPAMAPRAKQGFEIAVLIHEALAPHPSHASCDVDAGPLAWGARGAVCGARWPVRPVEQAEQLFGDEAGSRCINVPVTL